MATVTQIGPRLGIAPTCAARFGYRVRPTIDGGGPRGPGSHGAPRPRAQPGRARRRPRRRHEPRFADHAPAEVYATLLDTGQYVCSERTMYRLLAEHAEVRERRGLLSYRGPAVSRTPGTRVRSRPGVHPIIYPSPLPVTSMSMTVHGAVSPSSDSCSSNSCTAPSSSST